MLPRTLIAAALAAVLALGACATVDQTQPGGGGSSGVYVGVDGGR